MLKIKFLGCMGLMLGFSYSAAAPPTTAEIQRDASEAVQQWRDVVALIEQGYPIRHREAAALRPLRRDVIDRLWTMVEAPHDATAMLILGMVGESNDLTRLIKTLDETPAQARHDFVNIAVGLMGARHDADGQMAFEALQRCSQPKRIRAILGDSAEPASVYVVALSCVHQIPLRRDDEARQFLWEMSHMSHSEAMTEGFSNRFRIETLAAAYRLDRLASMEGSFEEVLDRDVRDPQRDRQAWLDLVRALEELNMTSKDVMKE